MRQASPPSGRSLAGIAGSNPARGMDVVSVGCYRGLCDGLITRPEESYRVFVCVCVCVSGCDREASTTTRPGTLRGLSYYKKGRLRESYETRYIYLPEGHKQLKQYLHEVSPLCQA